MNINVSIYFRDNSAKDPSDYGYDYEHVTQTQILAERRYKRNQPDIRPQRDKTRTSSSTAAVAAVAAVAAEGATSPGGDAASRIAPTTDIGSSSHSSRRRRQRRDIASSAPTSMHGKC